MKYEKSTLIELIKKIVYDVTQLHVSSSETNLLDMNIYPADFLYIFDLLEQELHVSATDILIGHSYHVLEISAMSEALLELLDN